MIAQRLMSPKGKGANIPNAVVDTAISRHKDGFGIAWRDPNRGLVYEKFGPDQSQDFRYVLKDLDADHTIEYVAHFRFATHGPEDASHAHPYEYIDPNGDPVLVFHNGVITGMPIDSKRESDTEVFVRDYLALLPPLWWLNEAIVGLVHKFIGWSRLVLMTPDDTINLSWNEGEEDSGFWYSSEHRPISYDWARGDEWEDEWVRLSEGKWVRKSEQTALVPLPPLSTQPRRNDASWMSQGHRITPLQSFNFTKDDAYEVSIICDECGTSGDVYIVDGRAYMDIKHKVDILDEEDPEEGDLLPRLVAQNA